MMEYNIIRFDKEAKLHTIILKTDKIKYKVYYVLQ